MKTIGGIERMRLKLIQLFMLVLVSALVLAGCGANQTDKVPKDEHEKLQVVTSFYPMYIAAINITKGIEGVEVKNMTKPQTGCLHNYQLTPEDLKTLEKANAFVVNGAGMESFLDKVIVQQDKLPVVDASKNIHLLKEAGIENPHVWVSVTNAIAQVHNIAEQLAVLDPAHAESYHKNAAAYIGKLETLKAEMHQTIDALPHKNIVTFHEAFPYLAEEFNLNIAAVIEREPGSEPTPRELEETIQKIKDLGVQALFAEPQYPSGAANIIAAESGAKVYTLDPLVTGDANPDAVDAYLNVMRQNTKVLQRALQ